MSRVSMLRGVQAGYLQKMAAVNAKEEVGNGAKAPLGTAGMNEDKTPPAGVDTAKTGPDAAGMRATDPSPEMSTAERIKDILSRYGLGVAGGAAVGGIGGVVVGSMGKNRGKKRALTLGALGALLGGGAGAGASALSPGLQAFSKGLPGMARDVMNKGYGAADKAVAWMRKEVEADKALLREITKDAKTAGSAQAEALQRKISAGETWLAQKQLEAEAFGAAAKERAGQAGSAVRATGDRLREIGGNAASSAANTIGAGVRQIMGSPE